MGHIAMLQLQRLQHPKVDEFCAFVYLSDQLTNPFSTQPVFMFAGVEGAKIGSARAKDALGKAALIGVVSVGAQCRFYFPTLLYNFLLCYHLEHSEL